MIFFVLINKGWEEKNLHQPSLNERRLLDMIYRDQIKKKQQIKRQNYYFYGLTDKST